MLLPDRLTAADQNMVEQRFEATAVPDFAID